MKLNIEGLKEKLAEATGDNDLAHALLEAAEVQAPEFEGTPDDFARAAVALMKETDPDKKFAPGASYARAVKVLAEAVENDPSPEQTTDKDDESDLSDEPDSPAENMPAGDEKPATGAPDMIKVKLAPKIAAYGGGFYDRISGSYIHHRKNEPGKPITVKRTIFVEGLLANKDLIEVKG
jgi:hypothetical protein